MMDRDHELAQNYSDISRQSKEVDGIWIMYEKEGYESWVAFYSTKEESQWHEIYHASRNWKATPVSIFRKT